MICPVKSTCPAGSANLLPGIPINCSFFNKTERSHRHLPLLLLLILTGTVLTLPLTGVAQMGVVLAAAGPTRQISPEHQLKAVYLYNFLNFVYWPIRECGPKQKNPRKIIVVGDSPFEDALKALQAKIKSSGKAPLNVVFLGHYRDDMDLAGCHLLFVSSSERASFRRIVASVADEPVLIVTDTEGSIENGGMINLISRHNKVRWAINRGQMQRAGLRLSAKLLDMAVKVVE